MAVKANIRLDQKTIDQVLAAAQRGKLPTTELWRMVQALQCLAQRADSGLVGCLDVFVRVLSSALLTNSFVPCPQDYKQRETEGQPKRVASAAVSYMQILLRKYTGGAAFVTTPALASGVTRTAPSSMAEYYSARQHETVLSAQYRELPAAQGWRAVLDGLPSFPHGDTIWNCYDPDAEAWIPTTLVNLQLCRRRGDRCQPLDIEEAEDWVRALWNLSERRKEHEQGQVKAAALSRLASVPTTQEQSVWDTSGNIEQVYC
jgi:hypothetical protein